MIFLSSEAAAVLYFFRISLKTLIKLINFKGGIAAARRAASYGAKVGIAENKTIGGLP